MKILLVKTSSLGDIIQCFPVLDYLRQKFPDAEIDWVVEKPFAELLRSHPQVNRVIAFESKRWRKNFLHFSHLRQIFSFLKTLREKRYDLLFDLQGNTKSGFVVCAARAAKRIGFGWRSVSEWPNALCTSFKFDPPLGQNVREEYLSLVKSYCRDENPHNYQPCLLKLDSLQHQKLLQIFSENVLPTLVCPASAWSNKCISEELLIQYLSQLNQPPYWFIWGNQQEREQALRLAAHFKESAVLERLSLPLLQHVMSRCRLVVSMDSLPLHLCATTATPTLSFFGPSSANKYAPVGKHHIAVQGSCPYGITFERRCPQLRTCKTGSCLKSGECIDGRVKTAIFTHFQG